MYYLGACYYFNNDPYFDEKENIKQKGIEYLEMASKKHYKYMNFLGNVLFFGEKNYEKGIECWHKSIEIITDSKQRQNYLFETGYKLCYGKNIYVKSEDQNIPEINDNINLNDEGDFPINERKAIYYWKIGADENCINCMRELALCYFYGKGIEKDIKNALYYFEKAANKGDINSLFMSSFVYSGSWGRSEKNIQHYKKALYYITKFYVFEEIRPINFKLLNEQDIKSFDEIFNKFFDLVYKKMDIIFIEKYIDNSIIECQRILYEFGEKIYGYDLSEYLSNDWCVEILFYEKSQKSDRRDISSNKECGFWLIFNELIKNHPFGNLLTKDYYGYQGYMFDSQKENQENVSDYINNHIDELISYIISEKKEDIFANKFNIKNIIDNSISTFCDVSQNVQIEQKFKETECCICLETFDKDFKPLEPCGHFVHKSCIIQSGSKKCPLCREEISISKKKLQKYTKKIKEKTKQNDYESRLNILKQEILNKDNYIKYLENLIPK